MKRTVALVAGLLVLMAAPAFSDWRFDIGAYVPRGLGGLADGGLSISESSTDFFDMYVFPFPFVEAQYQWALGPANVGVGGRAFTVIVETVFWPSAFAGIELGPVAIEGRLGGLYFGAIGVAPFSEAGSVLIPELSAWFKLGKIFRLGAGGIGIMLPDLDAIAFVYYIGGKFVLGG